MDTSTSITRHAGEIVRATREARLGQRAATVWLTGLSAAGKSTLAFALENALLAAGRLAYVLDGDNLRHGLCRDLGFSASDRRENIRRVAEVAALLNDAGPIAIAAFISPYRDDRAAARAIVGAERFLEVHVSTSLATCEVRDPKGLYRRARKGEMHEMTGVDAPYEAPGEEAMHVDAGVLSVAACVAAVMARLEPLVAARERIAPEQEKST